MRLGGPVYEKYDGPDGWTAAVKRLGYSAAYCPVDDKAGADVEAAYAKAAENAGLVIAEVGAWNNPLDRDERKRRQAVEFCKLRLALAERLGARCCVNIAGSRGPKWDGPDPDNLTDATFDLIVQTVREIIDAVKPARTFYALEPMPWAFPDSPDNYLRLMKAIDRRAFAVHLDVVNIINSPARYYYNADLIRECFAKLGPYIRVCHAKDILLADRLTVHLDEVRPGLGKLDYAVFLRQADKLDPDTPVLLEHLPSAGDYTLAAEYIRAVARREGLAFR
jgi:sugar phosphate isomerase/epimerase